MPDLTNRRVVMVVPPARFKEEELDAPKRILERNKCKVDIACSALKEVFGMAGGRARPGVLIDDVQVDDLDAVVFVGGMGSREYWDHEGAHGLARRAVEAGKIVGALSTAPVILARAGLLDGKEATVIFSETKQITERGAKYTGTPISVAGNIITCKGPEAAESFTMALMKLIS